jgi:hypothetical protein
MKSEGFHYIKKPPKNFKLEIIDREHMLAFGTIEDD